MNIDDEFEPLVAFACGRPSMYATTQGWKMDRTQGCLSNTEEILAYCALKYPGMEITNIIPAASEVSIGNWGAFMNSSETQTLSVRPYRCISKHKLNFIPLFLDPSRSLVHLAFGRLLWVFCRTSLVPWRYFTLAFLAIVNLS